MNCSTANDRLLDLLYEELEGPEAEETRAHVDQCESCRASLKKLSLTQRLLSVLPEEEPDRSLDAKILAAARQKVGAEPGRDEARRRDEEDGGLWGSILRWLTGFAASPQFVMATMMMLVVAIGLWYLPSSRRQPEASGGTVVNPDHMGEAAPSATLEPAEPLELDLDERTNRIRSRGDEASDTIAMQAAEGGREADRAPAAEPTPAVGAMQRTARGGGADGRTSKSLREAQARNAADDAVGADEGFGGLDREQAPARRSRAARPSYGGAGSGGSAPRADQGGFAREERAESEAAPAPGMTPSYPRSTSASAPPPSAPSGAGSAYGADSVQGPSRYDVRPDALHRRARNFASAGACRDAVREYQTLLRSFPRYDQQGQAMIEMAECQRRLDQLVAARSTLLAVERSYPTVAPEARRRRVHVEQMQRARSAPAEAASEAAH